MVSNRDLALGRTLSMVFNDFMAAGRTSSMAFCADMASQVFYSFMP